MEAPFTLTFEVFWGWLVAHPNCVLRAGSRDAVIYDEEDLHWHIANEPDGTLLVQVIRGKRLLGELFLEPERIDYVQAVPQENEEEYTFELIAEAETEGPAYFFVLVHGYEVEEAAIRRRVH